MNKGFRRKDQLVYSAIRGGGEKQTVVAQPGKKEGSMGPHLQTRKGKKELGGGSRIPGRASM